MENNLILELEGEAKEDYLRKITRCFEKIENTIVKDKTDPEIAENYTVVIANMLQTYIDTLRFFRYDSKSGIYKKISQDLQTGFLTPTQMLGLVAKKESIEEKIDSLYTKLSRIAELAGFENLLPPDPELAGYNTKSAPKKVQLLKKSLIDLVKEKVYNFTPEQEKLLAALGGYYKDEQEFFRELNFFEELEEAVIIRSKCRRSQKRIYDRYYYNVLDAMGIAQFYVALFGQFVNMPLLYEITVLSDTKKRELLLTGDVLEKLFGHDVTDIFNMLMGQKHIEPFAVKKVRFGPFYDKNTRVGNSTQEIVQKAGDGYVLDVLEESIKRGDKEFFKRGIFSKPKIITSQSDAVLKVCSPNLVADLKKEFPEATVVKAE